MEFAFAGLQQLCAPFVDRLERLPEPQREALGTAFGLRDGDAPDRFLVGLAVLSLLSDVAEERPLICVVDDAQWLDGATAQALAFVARRLGAESVGLVFAVREPAAERHLEGLAEIVVGGLDDQRRAGAAGGRDRGSARRAGARSDRGRDARQSAGAAGAATRPDAGGSWRAGSGWTDGPALSGRIEESFQERLAPLPPSTRLLLLVAAAEPVGDPLLVWKAAAALGIECRRGGAGEGGGPGRARRPGAVPASARSFRGVPRGRAGGAAARPPCARRGHRCRARSRSPRLAPRPGDGRARRGRRRRAGALGRACAGAGRAGGRRRVPRARRRADAGSETPGAARAGCGAGQAQAGASDAALRLLASGEVGTAGRPRARAGATVRRADRVRRDARPRRPSTAARGGQAARAARHDAGARDVPRGVRRCALGRPPRARR